MVRDVDVAIKKMAIDNKKQLYEKATVEIIDRFAKLGTSDLIARMATVSAVLKNTLPYYFWCGFYFAEDDELVIGPYQGTPACAIIGYTGVCGQGVKEKKTIIVPNVHEHPGHITCDDRSNSEIVVPLLDEGGRIIGVFDVDSTELGAFDDIDKNFLEQIMTLVIGKL